MTQTKLYDENGWQLISWGNGWAYSLADLTANKSVWFQDDDALAFEQHTMKDGWLVDNCEQLFADYSEVMQSI